jgi:hypothetical protein
LITVRLRRSRFIPAKRRRVEQTTGLHRTMAKVCNQDGEETFAGTRGNDKVAPKPDLPVLAPEQEVRPNADP